MEVEFKNKELLKLYETGSSRKLKLTQDIIDEFFFGVQSIIDAYDIYD